MILYRPVGLQELKLIVDSGYRTSPPRLPDQPIFYPGLNFEYAEQIAKGWNARYNDPPCGFVTKFEVDDEYIQRFPVQLAGARIHQELWVPAEELSEFNAHIIGQITVESAYYGASFEGVIDPETNLPKELTEGRS